jgi:hypothetical protein
VVIAAQFTITKLWNQPRCPSTLEWAKKLWHVYIYTMEYFLARRKIGIWSFGGKWMGPLGEISQTQKDK